MTISETKHADWYMRLCYYEFICELYGRILYTELSSYDITLWHFLHYRSKDMQKELDCKSLVSEMRLSFKDNGLLLTHSYKLRQKLM
jgi:hypothetical protein